MMEILFLLMDAWIMNIHVKIVVLNVEKAFVINVKLGGY